jgi:hypothetical protein
MKSSRFLPFVLTLFVAAGLLVPHRAEAALKDSVVIIIRHAEKEKKGNGLAPEGRRRADAYVGYFRNFTVDARPLKLVALFATKQSKKSNRPVDTITPLSRALGLPIHAQFTDDEAPNLAAQIESSPYEGKDILICWHHGKIHELIKALGAKPSELIPGGKWPEDIYNWAVELRYDKDGNLSAKILDENLMPGDSAHPPAL